jgi:hypothetical protein
VQLSQSVLIWDSQVQENSILVSLIAKLNFIVMTIFIIIAWIEGASIFIAVFIVAIVGSYNDYKKEE